MELKVPFDFRMVLTFHFNLLILNGIESSQTFPQSLGRSRLVNPQWN